MSSHKPTYASIRFREARKQAGLTQQELADKLGISKISINNYEKGASFPRAEILFGLFEVLNIDAREFFASEYSAEAESDEQ